MEADGTVVNRYVGHRLLEHSVPSTPWAVYLTADGLFRLLAFDLDAKGGGGEAARDAGTLSQLLEEAGVAHVVCASGPSGGRHVWVALSEGVNPDLVGSLARLAAALCPSLDVAPLSNPATGCVRPPGSPHRDGGTSTLLAGDLEVLVRPSTTAEQVTALTSRIAGLVSAHAAPGIRAEVGPLPVDSGGHRYLPGPKRALPAASRAALSEDAACGDASTVLWQVLLGAAAARWRHVDVAELVPTAAGLEHVRTVRSRGHRLARPARGPQAPDVVLARQWDRAVTHVASTARRAGDDATFDARAGAVADHVRELQVRADAATGRWTARGGGPTDRRVLDVLCTLALTAVTCEVEADVRRLALTAGIGRETARTALLRLAADGWIRQTRAADGPHGAHWTIDPRGVLHNESGIARSQADPRPEGAGSAERTLLLETLTARTADAAHDLFTSAGALGHTTGNLYARTAAPCLLEDLARTTGHSPAELASSLVALESAGLVAVTGTTCTRTAVDRRTAAAAALGVAGRLAARRRAYQVERDAWAWWLAERDWMTTPGSHRSKRRPAHQAPLWRVPGVDAYPKHPRTATGRADYRAARDAVAAGALDQPTVPSTPVRVAVAA